MKESLNRIRIKLFGSSAFTKEYLFGLEDYRKATWYQNFIASIAGSVCPPFPSDLLATSLSFRLQVSSIVISQPLDVIKVPHTYLIPFEHLNLHRTVQT